MRWYKRWWLNTAFAFESARAIRIRLRRLHGCSTPPLGVGWAGPFRRWLQQCCRCGRARVFGKFYEMYGSDLGGWYYACAECCLEAAATRLEALPQAGDDWVDQWGT